MTAKTSAKISYPRTLGAIKKVVCDSFGLHVILLPLANPLSIIKDIQLGVFSGNNKKLVEEKIETLLVKAGQPISTVITTIASTASETRVILVPLEFDVPTGSKAVFSYKEEIGGRRTIEFDL